MKYTRMEDLPVWQAAADLAKDVLELTGDAYFSRHSGLRDQLERAVLSISNNIAEGFDRGSNQELINFLYIARGSAAETRSMLSVLERIPALKSLAPKIAEHKSKVENISRQLGGWISSLKNSDLKGQRFVSDKTRQADQQSRERDEVLAASRRAMEDNIRSSALKAKGQSD